MNYYAYLLSCSDGTLYAGITNDLESRVAAHNEGKGAKYTSGRRPVALVYAEACGNRSEASKRELAIKKMKRAEKLKMIRDYR